VQKVASDTKRTYKIIPSLLTKFFIVLSVISFTLPWFIPLPYEKNVLVGELMRSPITLDFHLDALSLVMICAVLFISTLIQRYSRTYLESDSQRLRFLLRMSLLTGCVVWLAMSGSLLMAYVAWQGISLTLYSLLNHFNTSPKANLAARQQLMTHLFGDLCFLAAVIIAYNVYGTTNFKIMFAHYDHNDVMILWLILSALMTRCAQFPFYKWLINSMETPTPVSALMHAGIINVGGFLLARMGPMFTHEPSVMFAIFAIGLSTAWLGKFFMLTQADVKRQCAFSTMGQMGYMMMQCGLGCFASAIFHLIAHGFFKSYQFLNAGSVLNLSNCSSLKREPQKESVTTAYSVVCTFTLIGLGYAISRLVTQHPLSPVLWLFTAVSIYSLSSNMIKDTRGIARLTCLAMLAGMVSIYFLLLGGMAGILAGTLVSYTPTFDGPIFIGLVALVFSVTLLKHVLPARVFERVMTKLYVLSFYKGQYIKLQRKQVSEEGVYAPKRDVKQVVV